MYYDPKKIHIISFLALLPWLAAAQIEGTWLGFTLGEGYYEMREWHITKDSLTVTQINIDALTPDYMGRHGLPIRMNSMQGAYTRLDDDSYQFYGSTFQMEKRAADEWEVSGFPDGERSVLFKGGLSDFGVDTLPHPYLTGNAFWLDEETGTYMKKSIMDFTGVNVRGNYGLPLLRRETLWYFPVIFHIGERRFFADGFHFPIMEILEGKGHSLTVREYGEEIRELELHKKPDRINPDELNAEWLVILKDSLTARMSNPYTIYVGYPKLSFSNGRAYTPRPRRGQCGFLGKSGLFIYPNPNPRWEGDMKMPIMEAGGLYELDSRMEHKLLFKELYPEEGRSPRYLVLKKIGG